MPTANKTQILNFVLHLEPSFIIIINNNNNNIIIMPHQLGYQFSLYSVNKMTTSMQTEASNT